MTYDLLIKNGRILTCNQNNQLIESGYILIKDGKIALIKEGEAPTSISAKRVVDAKGSLVMPGFVNTHCHAAMTMFRGFADDLDLMDWLTNYIWPAEKLFATPENIYLSTKLAAIEMVKSGITTFNDMYFFQDDSARAIKEVGMRAVLGLFTHLPPMLSSLDLIPYQDLIKKYQHDELIKVAISAHSPYANSKEELIEAKKVARENNLLFHIHLAESDFEFDKFQSEHKMTPVEYMESLDLLDAQTLAVHCVKTTPKDISIFQKHNTAISHNPKSNLKLGNGFAQVAEMLASGLRVGLGTDGAASNNNLNMFEEMGFCARMHKGYNKNSTTLPSAAVVKMATFGGANALGLDSQIGSLEENKAADLQIINLNKPHLTPCYNPESHLVYVMQASDVDTVIINGKVVMYQRKMETIDEEAVMAEIRVLAEKIRAIKK